MGLVETVKYQLICLKRGRIILETMNVFFPVILGNFWNIFPCCLWEIFSRIWQKFLVMFENIWENFACFFKLSFYGQVDLERVEVAQLCKSWKFFPPLHSLCSLKPTCHKCHKHHHHQDHHHHYHHHHHYIACVPFNQTGTNWSEAMLSSQRKKIHS